MIETTTDPRAALNDALLAHGITTRAAFVARYGVAPDTLTVNAALALLREHEMPRQPDYAAALDALKVRLEAGLIVLATNPTEANVVWWLRLALRSVLLIARLSEALSGALAAWEDSDTGRWFAALDWPNAEPELLDAAMTPASRR